MFEEADPAVLTALLAGMTDRRTVFQRGVPAGSVVVREGELDDALYVVFQGRMAVTMAAADGTQEVVGELRPGDLFGELALGGNRRRGATVAARTDAALLVLSAVAWKQLAAELPNITNRLMLMVARRTHGRPRGGALGNLRPR